MIERTPPHSTEAEQSLIGALLLNNEALDRVADLVGAEDFYRDDHRRIWRHIVRMIEANRPADVLTVHESIESSDDRGKVGPAYIAELAQNTPSAINVRQYAEVVRQRSIQRRIALVGTEIAEAALGAVQDVNVLMDEAESKVLKVSEASARRDEGPVSVKSYLAKVFERIDHLYMQDGRTDVTGIATGFMRVDEMTSGLQPGDLVVVAGRPSMGKTALALNIAEHVALELKMPAAVFSMEMSGTQLAQRLLASVARIDGHKLRTAKLSDREWSQLSDAMSKMHEAPIEVDEGGALSVMEIRSRARRLRRRYGKLGVVVIDYLQLMKGPGGHENRATQISEITRGLKSMAKELDCPVVVLSQLNRSVDERPDKRPIMSDLRESGAIEQDADLIMFMYREVVYKPDLPDEQRGIAELIIGKQRNGPIGTVPLTYLGQYTRFENYASADGSPYLPRRTKPVRNVTNFVDFKASAAGEAA